jgi:hypothetical protein
LESASAKVKVVNQKKDDSCKFLRQFSFSKPTTTSDTNSKLHPSTMTTSQVKVAIRLRPLTTKEITSNGTPILTTTPNTVSLSNRTFTYDAVYNDAISQSMLYQDVAPPLLDAFLGGYNATVMAYGQTSSGKTYR